MVQNSLDISLLVVNCVECVCMYIKQNTLLLKLLALFSLSLAPLFRLFHPASVFCGLNQQVADGPVGNLYRSLDALDLLAEASLFFSLKILKLCSITTFPTSYLH